MAKKNAYTALSGSTAYSRKPPVATPQSQPIPGQEAKMVQNNAGGYTYAVDTFSRLTRFLILGSSAPQYYVKPSKLTAENAKTVVDCLDQDAARTIEEIAAVSEAGRAAKNDAAILALAIAASYGLGKISAANGANYAKSVRKLAVEAAPRIVRTGTHRFHFAEHLSKLRGKGPLFRSVFGGLFNDMTPMKLARQLVKYKNRDGWSNKDLLVLSHPIPATPVHGALYHYAVYGSLPAEYPADPAIDYLQAAEGLHSAGVTEKDVIAAINTYKLEREMIPTQFLRSKAVWEALLPNLGMEALIRNLGNMGSVGILDVGNSSVVKFVKSTLKSDKVLLSKLHPIKILAAMLVYKQGHGVKGDNTWKVVPQVLDALDDAFYSAFGNVQPTGKSTALYLDVSGSMFGASVEGIEFANAATVAAAMAMVTYRTEDVAILRGFSHRPVDINIRPDDTLEKVVETIGAIPMGGTDCALPMLDALEKGYKVDNFGVYTDNETWFGRIHPSQALKNYRQRTGINARLAVVATSATKFTIADPDDKGMLDFVGFDTAAPEMMAGFFRGDLD